MSRNVAASLPILPVEILHRIFDELEGTTIFLSVRNVCQSLRAAVNSYRGYALDLTSVSKYEFHRILHIVRPEWVTSLSLSDEETTIEQIDLFRSLVAIDRFTRLRSLTLLNIDGPDLCAFLKHAKNCSLTSLSLQLRSIRYTPPEEIAQNLLSIIGQPYFVRLELFLDEQQSSLLRQFKWPIPCKLRCLKIRWKTLEGVPQMIAGSPDLETLVLVHADIDFFRSDDLEGRDFFSAPCPRLTSLTLSNCSLGMDEIESILSRTPSLRHLKIVTRSPGMMNGSRWEEIFKIQLPFLSKFDLYTCSFLHRSTEQTVESKLNEMIDQFRTPFWTEEKRWLVICHYYPTSSTIEIYTSPICISDYRHLFGSKVMTISNFEREDQHSTLLLSVNKLWVNLFEIHGDDRDVDLNDHRSPASKPFSSVIDLFKLATLWLCWTYSSQPDAMRYNCLITLLQQASNIHSLLVHPIGDRGAPGPETETIPSTIIRYVNSSKLRYLNVFIGDIHEVEMLLNRFRNLFSIQFEIWRPLIPCEKIIEYVKILMPECSIAHTSSSVRIWMGQRVERTNTHERQKLSHRSEIM